MSQWLANQAPAIVILCAVAAALLKRFDKADDERAELMRENGELQGKLELLSETAERHNTELQILRDQLAECLGRDKEQT